ncbi:MAG: dihydrodipicolinate synthase family protein [Candidatus Micrarchaeia archaeon]
MIQGIIPATVLPMDKNFNPAYEEYGKYVKWLTKTGIAGIAVNVDTGEGPLLLSKEKVEAIKVAKLNSNGKKVIAGIIGASTAMASEAAREAKRAGADAGLIFPNLTLAGPMNDNTLVEHYKKLSEDADLDVILFQLQPALGGIDLPLDTLMQVAKLKRVIGIKEASFDAKKFLDGLRAFKKHFPNVSFLTGNDNFIYESFILGCDGALIGFGTLAPQQIVDMFELVKKERYNEAGEIWERLLPLEEVIFEPPVRNYRAKTKYALSLMGVIKTEYTFVRPPLRAPNEAEKERIRSSLKKAELI